MVSYRSSSLDTAGFCNRHEAHGACSVHYLLGASGLRGGVRGREARVGDWNCNRKFWYRSMNLRQFRLIAKGTKG